MINFCYHLCLSAWHIKTINHLCIYLALNYSICYMKIQIHVHSGRSHVQHMIKFPKKKICFSKLLQALDHNTRPPEEMKFPRFINCMFFCFSVQVVLTFARHYKTGDVIPQDLVDNLFNSRKLFAASVTFLLNLFSVIESEKLV